MNIENLDIVKELISEKENGQVEFKAVSYTHLRAHETSV